MKNLLLYLMLLCPILFLTNCGDDDVAPIVETTVEEDKANVDQTLDDVLKCTEDIRDGRSLTEVFDNFLNMSDGESMNEEWVTNIFEELERVVDFEKIDENMTFDLAYHAGTHTYNASTGKWAKANNVTDKVVLNFPSSPDSNTNNVEFVIDTYTDEVVTIDGETMSLPKSFHALLNIDNAKAVELTLSNITYAQNSGFQIPVEISASLFLDPMNVNLEVSRMSDTSFDMTMSMDNDKICDVELASQFELTSADFENLDMDSFEKASLQINVGQMSFKTMGNLASLIAMEEPTDSEINSMADFDLFFNDFKIADIEINDEMETILILYKDASTGNMDSFLERMGEIMENLFG